MLRWLYLGAKVLQATLPLVGWYALGMPRPALRGGALSRRGVLAGVVTGSVMGGGALAVWLSPLARWQAFAPVAEQARQRLQALDLATPAGYLLLAVGLSVAHSLFEEYYWRWFALGELARRLPRSTALLAASLAFAAHHWIVLDCFLAGSYRWTAVLPLTLLVAASGAVWGWLFLRFRTLLPPWLSHLLVDAALMAIGYRLVFG
jgi:membrane protease YdiL (CAAX protease family)